MKKVNTKLKLSAYLTLTILIGLVAVFGVVSASNGSFWDKLADKAGEVLGLKLADKTENLSEPFLGSVTSPMLENLWFGINGNVTYNITGSFQDATTTFFSIANPFGTATNTDAVVRFVRLNITTLASSTASAISFFRCGASTVASGVPSYEILTSDAGNATTTGYIYNGMTAAYNGVTGLGGGTVQKIALTQTYPYFVCYVSSTVAAAYTDAAETFAGKVTVEISKYVY